MRRPCPCFPCCPQEAVVEAPSKCAAASASTLTALGAMFPNGSLWADSARHCGTVQLQMTTPRPPPRAIDCATFADTVRAAAGLCCHPLCSACWAMRTLAVRAATQLSPPPMLHLARAPQYEVVSPVALATANGSLLANTTASVQGMPCPLPDFGGDARANLLVERTWNW